MQLRGSYTIEAALIVPVYLFLVVIALRAGILLYQEIKQQELGESLESMWCVEEFYNYQAWKGVCDD